MQKKLITKLLVATILSMTISTEIAYAKTDTKNIDETNNKIVEEQQKSIINKEKQDSQPSTRPGIQGQALLRQQVRHRPVHLGRHHAHHQSDRGG